MEKMEKIAVLMGGTSSEREVSLVSGRNVAEALAQDPGAWMKLDRLPPDMVVYRYRNDSLQSWCHQFPVINDDIGTRVVFQRLTSLRSDVVSPLSFVTDEVSYMNLGTKWYLVKSASEGSCRVIAGLEIPDAAEDRFSVVPLSSSGGGPVSVGGVPPSAKGARA